MRLWIFVPLLLATPCVAGLGIGVTPYPGPGVLGAAASYVKVFDASVYPTDTPTGGATYCVRQDGSAVKASATSCADASTSMSPATFNSSTFSDTDIIYISDRGGNISTALTIPSGGSSAANRITYRGEAAHTPTISATGGVVISSKNNIDLVDITVNAAGESNFLFEGTSTGIRTYNLKGYASTNQTFQHLNTVSVTHNNLYANGADDEGISIHDSGAVTVNGGIIEDCNTGTSYAGTPAYTINDVWIKNPTARAIESVASGGSLTINGCLVEESLTNTTDPTLRVPFGTVYIRNSIFKNLTDGDYYLSLPNTLTAAEVTGNIFYGRSGITTTAISNALVGTIVENNIFYGTGTNSVSNERGVVSNIMYNSGGAKGFNASTSDPGFADAANNDFSFSAASPAYKTGSVLDSLYTSDYIRASRRASKQWDIGPVQVSADAVATPSGLVEVGFAQFVPASGVSIYVPPNAELAVLMAGWYEGSSITFSSLTLGGVSLSEARTSYTTGQNTTAIWKLDDPTPGVSVLEYTISGTPDEGPGIWIVFFANATSTEISEGGLGSSDSNTISAGTLTANNGDLIVAVCGQYQSGGADGDVMSMSGVTEKDNRYNNQQRFWYGYSLASGNTAVSCTNASGSNYKGITGVVFDAE